MSLINKDVSDFTVQSFLNGEFKEVKKEDILGKWSVFFFYPADFTFVCPTELEDLANNYEEFQKIGCEIYSVSCDSHFVHKAWHDASKTIKKINYPMLADPTGAIARDFDVMIEADGMAERGSFNQKTNLDGVYAAGDVCMKELRQVVTAVSDGAIAATSLEKYVSDLHVNLNIPELEITRKYTRSTEEKQQVENNETSDEEFLSSEIKNQLKGIFEKFEHSVILKTWLDDRKISDEVRSFLEEFVSLTDKVTWIEEKDSMVGNRLLPTIEVCYADGTSSGIQFHGVPGGHELNSFVIALYNVAGPGKVIEPDVEKKIKDIKKPVNLKVIISLSCTMCPEVVMATQKAATLSDKIEAEMIDLMHYPELKEKYQIMSVPCLVVNDETVYFGKKGISEIADIISQ